MMNSKRNNQSDRRRTQRRKADRRTSDRTYDYADGVVHAVVLFDKPHMVYRIELREGDNLLAIHTEHDHDKAMQIARTMVKYVNRRGK